MSKNTDLGNLVNGLFVSSTRNVGIGMTAPANAVVVDKGTATASYLQFTAGTTTGQLATDGFEVGIDASGNGIISQQENLPLMIYTNSAERMRITAAGNVGINTTSFTGFGSRLQMIMRGDATSGVSVFQVVSNDSASSVALFSGANSSDAPAIIYQKDLRFGSVTDSGLGGYTDRMRITSTGNLAINNTNPDFGNFGVTEKIIGISSSGERARFHFQNTSTGTGGVAGTLAFFNGSTQLASLDVIADGATNRGYYQFNINNGSGNNERMRITSNGNVAIGTTTDNGFKLNVNGSINSSGNINISGQAKAPSGFVSTEAYIYIPLNSWTTFYTMSGIGIYTALINLESFEDITQFGAYCMVFASNSNVSVPISVNGSNVQIRVSGMNIQCLLTSGLGYGRTMFYKILRT